MLEYYQMHYETYYFYAVIYIKLQIDDLKIITVLIANIDFIFYQELHFMKNPFGKMNLLCLQLLYFEKLYYF